MPKEKRDPQSGAKLFVPSVTEKSMLNKQVELNSELEEVKSLKEELKEMLGKENKEDDE